jgi:hypothetical protein
MALQNVDGVLTGRGLMDCLQYYDNCLFILLDMVQHYLHENKRLYFVFLNEKML